MQHFDLWYNFAFAAFEYFTINQEPYRNNRQRCLEMLTLDSAWENLASELVSGQIQIELTEHKGLRTKSP